MESLKIESGVQLFSRLNRRPTLDNLHPILFRQGGPYPKQATEITGKGSVGKTLLLTDLVARCILPKQYNGINIPGKGCGAIIINTDYKFEMFRLTNAITYILKNCCNSSVRFLNSDIQCIIKSSLKNLLVLNCYDTSQLYITFLNIEKLLLENQNISVIAIDSIWSQYWVDRLNTGVISMHAYYGKFLSKLQNIVNDFSIHLMYTKPIIDSTMSVKYSNMHRSEAENRIILNSNESRAHLIIGDKPPIVLSYMLQQVVVFNSAEC